MRSQNLQRLQIFQTVNQSQEDKMLHTIKRFQRGRFLRVNKFQMIITLQKLKVFLMLQRIKAARHQWVKQARQGFWVWGACRGWALQEDWNAAFYIVEATTSTPTVQQRGLSLKSLVIAWYPLLYVAFVIWGKCGPIKGRNQIENQLIIKRDKDF